MLGFTLACEIGACFFLNVWIAEAPISNTAVNHLDEFLEQWFPALTSHKKR